MRLVKLSVGVKRIGKVSEIGQKFFLGVNQLGQVELWNFVLEQVGLDNIFAGVRGIRQIN